MIEKSSKERRAKRRPHELPPEFIGSHLDEPDKQNYLRRHGVATMDLGNDIDGIPLPILSGVLGKGGWVVDRYQHFEDGHFLVFARYMNVPTTCDRCEGYNLIFYGCQTQKFQDMPHRMKPTTLVVARQRLRCTDCGKTQFQLMPDMDSKHMMTNDLKDYIRKEAMQRTFTSVADDVGVDESTVRRIFGEYADELEKQHIIYSPEWLGIDEVHLTREMRCVLTDVSARKPLDILKTRTKQAVSAWLLQHMDPKVVKVVTMDMWNPYREAVHAALPGVKIVVDKFHVDKYANKALETVRKSTHKNLTDYQRKQLKHDRKVMLMRRGDLNPQQQLILETWLGNFTDLGEAYLLKEAFFDLYSFPTKYDAEAAYQTWLEILSKQSDPIQDAFMELVRLMGNWHEEIFNYFDVQATNAYTESVNALLKQIYRNGRGYSFKAIRAKVLYGKIGDQR